ncbi:MAG: glycoside hydrolase family 78 protein [Dysgonamonadaceae bacterium]|jgi:alpha-L-rhamnosidase|nr:glycoside hydrolase family 78 protein [Dysgonamonadaceae bacterium]
MKNIFCCYCAIAALSLTSFNGLAFSAVTVTELKCENLINPNAIDNTTPHFSWKILYDGGAMQQQFYEIQVSSDSVALTTGNADLWNSGQRESSSSVMVPYQGEALSSRSLAYWRVRVWNDKAEVSDWSPIARFGVGIINREEWQGTFIGLSSSAANTETPLLRKKFTVTDNSIAFLHVNSLGYHEVYINGKKVSDAVLSPAVSQLNKRSLSLTYDVTSLLDPGENEIVLWLGSGWYKNTAYDMSPITPAPAGALVNAQLDLLKNGEWETLVSTDSSWEGRETGYKDTGTWNANRFGGERVNAKLLPKNLNPETLDTLSWTPAVEVSIPNLILSPQMTEPDKIQEVITPVSLTKLSIGVWLVDMGKTVNGWFEIKFPKLLTGQTVIFDYYDFRDKDGNLEDQGQKDYFTGSGAANEVFCNKFNYHAFRYVKISVMTIVPEIENMKAYLIHTGYRPAASFECSDADLNAIHDMIQYTLRCLAYEGYMVDCPHIERAGYGGDGNSSTTTLQTLFDVSPLYHNWLTAWGDVMREGGSLPYVAPNPGGGGGGPYWCGFIIMAPWRTYVNYRDDRLIRKYYPAMKQWLEYVEKYTVNGLLKEWPNTDYRMWYLGDWLTPTNAVGSNSDLVNNCFISECLAVMEKIAGILGKPEEAPDFKQRKETLDAIIHSTYYRSSSKTYANAAQLDLAYPMLVGVTPANLYAGVKTQLLERTANRDRGHIGGGLVGVPIITEWAIRNHAADMMYTLLKKRDYPGYLYMIDNGATTTWEYWSGERSRVHNCYNGIGAWFYQAVGGIRPDENNPGYKHVYIEPQIPAGVTWAKTTKESPYGTIAVDWQITGTDRLTYRISLPANTTATVLLPENATGCFVNGEAVTVSDNKAIEIENGRYDLTLYLNGSTPVRPVKNTTMMDVPITVYDLYGRTVAKQKTDALPRGIYLLKKGGEAVKMVK